MNDALINQFTQIQKDLTNLEKEISKFGRELDSGKWDNDPLGALKVQKRHEDRKAELDARRRAEHLK